jgi:hypothetical protein
MMKSRTDLREKSLRIPFRGDAVEPLFKTLTVELRLPGGLRSKSYEIGTAGGTVLGSACGFVRSCRGGPWLKPRVSHTKPPKKRARRVLESRGRQPCPATPR